MYGYHFYVYAMSYRSTKLLFIWRIFLPAIFLCASHLSWEGGFMAPTLSSLLWLHTLIVSALVIGTMLI